MILSKKHDEFCLKQKLRPSTIVMLRAILRKTNDHSISQIEIDLRVINRWVEKFRGRGYDRKTLKSALAQLDECTDGLIPIEKSYTWAIHKIIVRPLSFVLSPKNPNLGKPPKPPTGNPMFDADRKKEAVKQQQQNISKLDAIFQKVGLHYDRSALNRIWRLSGKCLDSIKESIELLLYRHSTQADKIKNPQGWIINCLKQGWAKGFNLYCQPELPYFKTGEAIDR